MRLAQNPRQFQHSGGHDDNACTMTLEESAASAKLAAAGVMPPVVGISHGTPSSVCMHRQVCHY